MAELVQLRTKKAPRQDGYGVGRSDASARRVFIAAMMLPAIVLLLSFTLLPFAISVWLSLTDYMLSNPPARFVGLGNYAELLLSKAFWSALSLSMVFTTAAVSLETAVGIAIAVLLSRTHRRLAGPLRTLFILPLAVTPVAAMFTFRMMLNPSLGVANYFMRQLSLPPQDWLGSAGWALASLVVVDAWHWTPFVILIIAGGLASLPSEPVEAAQIDGASDWQIFCFITLPMLFPFVVIAILLRSIDAFKAFDAFYILTGGGPGTSTTTLNLFAFKEAIEFTALGRGSAIAIIVMIIITVVAQWLLRRTKLLQISGAGT